MMITGSAGLDSWASFLAPLRSLLPPWALAPLKGSRTKPPALPEVI
jgi:hypothetical protein